MAITLKRAVNYRSLSKLQSVVLAVQDKTQTLEISTTRSCTNLIQIKAWRDTKKKKKKLWTTLRTAVSYGKQSHQTLRW